MTGYTVGDDYAKGMRAEKWDLHAPQVVVKSPGELGTVLMTNEAMGGSLGLEARYPLLDFAVVQEW